MATAPWRARDARSGEVVRGEGPGPAGHGERADESGPGERHAQEPGQRRSQIVAAHRVRRVITGDVHPQRHAALGDPGGDAVSRAELAPDRGVAVPVGRPDRHVPEVAPLHEEDADGGGAGELAGRGHERLEEPVEVRLGGEAGAHVVQDLEPARRFPEARDAGGGSPRAARRGRWPPAPARRSRIDWRASFCR